MPKGIAVLGLDAADPLLVERWNCKNLQLDRHAQIETFSYSRDTPKTSEIWPTIATGVHPKEHGIDQTRNVEWSNPVLRTVSIATSIFPDHVRTWLGKQIRSEGSNDGNNMRLPTTDHNHMFEDGAVYEWPGVTPAPHWIEATSWSNQSMTNGELRQQIYAHTGKEIGWLAESIQAGIPVAGVQCHILDIAGHTFAARENKLRSYYKHVDEVVGWLRKRVSRLVIVSDHGMHSECLGDDQPGTHSWRAMCSAEGMDGDLPESVFEIRSFVEDNRGFEEGSFTSKVSIDAPENHLKDLGYLE